MHNDSVTDIVFNILHSYKMAMRSTLKDHEAGLNGMNVKCLTFISKSQNCTANDIVIFFNRDKAQIARLIKEMITNGWLTKTANPEDKRSQLLQLTEQGKELAELIRVTELQIYEKMQENIPAEQLASFKSTALMISANLKAF
ncbi:MarR family transcriptional regulator [Psychromonas marina]|uniref:MarR family transcriptional regulator n=1 Tax=Psychromonas marina TaxID=88364 RepID=A0ABQ6E4X0_9GAMM|nr:MarR family transcriptional regulator [Psychromonas marina]GLS92459.1 MarR family transcriptional regulator [Psychromonas marina]